MDFSRFLPHNGIRSSQEGNVFFHQTAKNIRWRWGEQSSRWITLQLTHMSQLMLHVQKHSTMWGSLALMYQSIPKPPITPRAIPGHLTRVKLLTVGNLTQNEARWGIWLSCQNVFQRSETKGFHNSLIQHVSRVPGSLLFVDSTWVFLLLSFYIVISWNMPLFKVCSKDKLNKNFVVAQNFAEFVSIGKRFCYIRLFHE